MEKNTEIQARNNGDRSSRWGHGDGDRGDLWNRFRKQNQEVVIDGQCAWREGSEREESRMTLARATAGWWFPLLDKGTLGVEYLLSIGCILHELVSQLRQGPLNYGRLAQRGGMDEKILLPWECRLPGTEVCTWWLYVGGAASERRRGIEFLWGKRIHLLVSYEPAIPSMQLPFLWFWRAVCQGHTI